MAADAFTQIRNAVFRDPRLSAKAMGIFGNISTHRDGWGITPESISTQMRDGVDAIKSGLRELEQHGYLQRTRERRQDGTLGAAVYFITDQPEAITPTVAGEDPSSEPKGDFPPQAPPPQERPAQAGPTVANHPHKKTTSKNPKQENTTLPPTPRRAARREAEPIGKECGRPATLTDDEQAAADTLTRATAGIPQLLLGEREIASLAPLVVPWLARDAGSQLRQALTAGLPPAVASPAGLLRRRLIEKLPPSPVPTPTPGLPDWCGACDGPEPARRWIETPKGVARCPACNPRAVAAKPTAARVS